MIRAFLTGRAARLALWFGCILATLLLAPTPAQAAGGTPDCTDSVTETSYTYSCQDAVYRGGLSGSRTIVFPAGAQRGVTAVSGTAWSAANYASYSPNPANWGNLLPFVQNNTLTVSWSSGVPPGHENSAINWTVTVSFLPRPIITSCSASPNPVTLANGQATTTLTGLSSDPAGGAVTKYDWDFGDGTTGVSDAGSSPTNRVASIPAADLPPLAQALAPPLAHAAGGGFVLTPTATASISANPTGIFAGESSTLTWSASGLDRSTFTITASNSIGTRTATIRFPDGSLQIASGPSGQFGATSRGEATAGQAVSQVIRQLVHPETALAAGGGGGGEPSEPPEITFTWSGSSAPVLQGSFVTLQWRVVGATSVTSNFGDIAHVGSQRVQVGYFTVTSNFLPTTPASGTQAVTPTVSTLYSITATDLNGPTTAYASVAVNRPPISHTYTQAGSYTVKVTATSSSGNTGSGSCTVTVSPGVTVDLKANGSDGPITLALTDAVILSWSTENATECTASGNPAWSGSKPTASAGVAAQPATAGTYTLTCTGPGGTGSDRVVVDIPPGDFTLGPPAVVCLANGSAQVALTWTGAQGATNYVVKRSLAGGAETTVATTGELTATDTVANAGSQPYRYVVEAANASTTATRSDAVTGTFSCGSCATSLRAVIVPATATVMVGQSQAFRVTATLNTAPVDPATTTVQWSVPTATAGTVVADSVDPLQATFTAGSTLGSFNPGVQALVRSGGCEVAAVVPVTIIPFVGGISGDVFSGGSVSGITISDPNSVVSASKEILNVNGTNFKIPGYQPSNSLEWDKARTAILAQAASLRSERVAPRRVLKTGGSDPTTANNFTIGGSLTSFHLNPRSGDDFRQTSSRQNPAQPEGGVWYVPGDLTIKGPILFYGRGTIIVDGNVTIAGDRISYGNASGSLGILLTKNGSVTVEPTVTKLVGAYFVPNGAIQFSASTPIDDDLSTETTVSVPVDGTIVSSGKPLRASGSYRLTAAGEATVRTSGVTLFADAEYFYEPGQLPAAPHGGDINPTSCAGSPTTDNGIETGVNLTTQIPALKQTRWGAFTVTHTYQTTVTGTGNPLQLRYIDCSYTDNSGSPLSVTITPVSLPSIQSSPLTATGLFVGNSIQLNRTPVSIRYDGAAIGQRTPPGFGVVTLPKVKESAP